MQTVAIDIETVLDEEAADRCGYTASDEFAPFPLHTIVCASTFSVTSTAGSENLYAIESFSRRSMGERGIVASVEAAIGNANVVLTYNGSRFDLPVLLTRAMAHEVHVPALLQLQDRSRVGRHLDLLEQIKRDVAPVSLRQLCAAVEIPVKQAPATVSQLVTDEDWVSLERYCESDAVGCWLASQFWNRMHEPGLAREMWRDFARWIAANADEHPGLAQFATVPEPPRPENQVNLEDLYF